MPNLNDLVEYLEEETKKNADIFAFDTISAMLECVDYLKKSAIYFNRIQNLLNNTDDEDSFHEKLKSDLQKEILL